MPFQYGEPYFVEQTHDSLPSFTLMTLRKLLAWYLLVGTALFPVSFAQAQLTPTVPTPSVQTQTSVPAPVVETTTVTTGSSSSSVRVEVTTTPTTQMDIITDPITTETTAVAAELSSSSVAVDINPDAYGPVISNVTISSITPVGGVIAWTTDELADSQIEYGLTDAYGFETSLDVALGVAHIQTLTNLQPGTDYHFRVKSKDAAGNVTISEDHLFTTVSAPIVLDIPPIILTQTVGSVTPTGVTIAWTTDEIADAQIEYGPTTAYGSRSLIDASFGLAHSVTLSDLTPATVYHYRIKTADSAGQVTYSGDDTFTTGSLVVTVEPSSGISGTVSSVSSTVNVPLAVSDVQATELTFSSALLAWTTSTLADAQIEYGLTTDYGSHTTIDVSLTSVHAELLSNLSPGTTYHYRVKSTDASGNLVVSDDRTFTTLAAPPATVSLSSLPTISDVTISAITSSTATIAWMTDKLANSQIEFGLTDAFGSESTLNAAFANTHVVILNDLEAGTTYHYRIRTTDAGGRLTLGEENTFTTSAALSSGVSSASLPTISTVETSTLTASSARITWLVSVPTDGQVEYGLTTSYGSSSTVDSSLSLTHETLLTGLTPDTTYHYRVKSIDAAGNRILSGDETFTTLELPTDQTAPIISAVTVSALGTSSATITWTTDDASDTRVQYGETTAYGVYTDLDVTPATVHSETITGLFPDTTYHFTVQSKDSAGNTAISIDHSFHTPIAPYTSGAMSVPVVSQITDTSLTIAWTVPFDDSAGTEFYDIRYSTQPITEENFERATPAREGVEHIVHVNDGGTTTEHIYMIIQLDPGTSYYFGIQSGASRSTLAHLEETLPERTSELSSSTESLSAATIPNAGNSVGTVTGGGGSQGTTGAASRGSGGGGSAISSNDQTSGGGNGRYRRLPTPRSLQAQAADSEVAFVWQSPLNSPSIHTDIIRKEGGFPTSQTDGEVIYAGRNENFTDTNLTNGKKYHYAFYSHNDAATVHAFSRPILVAMLPTTDTEQYVMHETPDIAPVIHTLRLQRDLVQGARGEDVKILQAFLKARGLYPIDITGYFGSYTLAGVKEFQKQHGLPATGAVSSMTRAKMRE